MRQVSGDLLPGHAVGLSIEKSGGGIVRRARRGQEKNLGDDKCKSQQKQMLRKIAEERGKSREF